MPSTETSVAGDLLRNGYERWVRLEEEKAVVSADLKELFAELKAHGFDGKALRAAFRTVAKVDDLSAQEHNAVVDLYVNSLLGNRVGTENANAQARSAGEPEHDPETGEITEPQEAQAPAQAGHASLIPDAQSGAGNVGNSLPGTESAEDRDTITEPQPIPQAERDLTDPKPLGQVATNPEAKASEDGGATVQHIGSADDSVTGDVSRASDGAGPVATIQPETAEHVGEAQKVERRSPKPEDAGSIPAADANAGSSNGRTAEFDSADAGSTPAPASIIYPAPGVVVMETCPPEGALAHPYAACWPVRDIDVSEGVREPIVKIGKLILDGRGRMFAARGWDGGKGREYPVVQYDGTDPLMDCIRWNLASRPGIHSHNLKLIAGKLAKLEPTRADEIMQAFGFEVAEAAQ